MATPVPLSLFHLPSPRRLPLRRSLCAVSGDPAKVPEISIPNVTPAPMVVGGLEVLYEDGYGTESVKDYLDAARDIIKPDGAGPRWFCPVECGQPVADSPVLLFLPGIDGVGMGLILHHKSLGKVFEVRCLHIPTNDRTSFEALVKFVEQSVKYEHAATPNKPIYLVGDSFGGCLALAVAARNPTVDLVLVLVNPGDPVKMAMASLVDDLPPQQALDELSKSLSSLLPRLSDLADIIPRETLLWKLKLLKSATSYVNFRLHAVEAEVLLLASGKDNLLPSGDEADRLWNSLRNCRVRFFKDSGHTLLLEDDINLLSIIKATRMYRHSRNYDFVTDYLPPSITEFKKTCEQEFRLYNLATSPVILSTLGDGRIVRGLAGVPNTGPVLLVGYHMLIASDVAPLIKEFLKEKKVIIRGLAHPVFFSRKSETSRSEFSLFDRITLFGGLPVSPLNMYRLFSRQLFVLLYPGGAREALHRKGEEYKLFWPDQPEFVRMAARFGATIVPFGTVGEDDIAELVLDYDDLTSIPFMRKLIEDTNKDIERVRTNIGGELSNQDLFYPGIVPKLPGRFYYLFGKPIETRGMKETLTDRNKANEVY